MRVSTRARYAVRLMVDLARDYDGVHPVHLRQIAEENDLSHGYLEQLMISLRNASLVRGVSGRKGGYLLARPANEIKMTEIVEAVIGPINLVECVLRPENCERSTTCESRPIWVMMNSLIIQTLDRYSVADLANPGWMKRITKELAPLAGDLVYPKKVIRRRLKAAGLSDGALPVFSRAGVCGRPMSRKPATRAKRPRAKRK